MHRLSAFTTICLVISLCANAQPAYTGQYNFANGDPATAFNKYLVAREDRTFVQIGQYKVIGSSYLFGPRHKGMVYAKGELGSNITLSYNTYNQQIEYFAPANPEQALVKEVGTVDSFLIKKDSIVPEDLLFVYSAHLQVPEKCYYLEVVKGDKFSLYKKYKASIGFVTTNYIDGNLRQFDIDADYFYFNEQTKQLRKLKPNTSFIKKEFALKDVSEYVSEDELSYNKEAALKFLFIGLNKK
jgi:hypothetical protein